MLLEVNVWFTGFNQQWFGRHQLFNDRHLMYSSLYFMFIKTSSHFIAMVTIKRIIKHAARFLLVDSFAFR